MNEKEFFSAVREMRRLQLMNNKTMPQALRTQRKALENTIDEEIARRASANNETEK